MKTKQLPTHPSKSLNLDITYCRGTKCPRALFAQCGRSVRQIELYLADTGQMHLQRPVSQADFSKDMPSNPADDIVCPVFLT